MFGFLNIYKPTGMTSHDVVSRLRKLTGIKRIGHTGTLDPFAEGVLPICIGKATRLIEYLDDDKEYLATVQFGKSTTTFDREGDFTFETDKKISQDDVITALKSFEGEIEQIPPIYSAIKIKGKKLYEYAREGKDVEIQPRKVTIEMISLETFEEDNQTAQIRIRCSKGTYIRSIANDLGKLLGVGGYLINLIRTKAGSFLVSTAQPLEGIDVLQNLINPLDILTLEKLEVTDEEQEKILHGQALVNKSFKNGTFIILIYNKKVSAIALVENELLKIKKVIC